MRMVDCMSLALGKDTTYPANTVLRLPWALSPGDVIEIQPLDFKFTGTTPAPDDSVSTVLVRGDTVASPDDVLCQTTHEYRAPTNSIPITVLVKFTGFASICLLGIGSVKGNYMLRLYRACGCGG